MAFGLNGWQLLVAQGFGRLQGIGVFTWDALTTLVVCTILSVRTMTIFDWDEEKNESNRAKHGIDFGTAQLVFDDPYHVAFVANVVDGEERWTAIGLAESVIVLFVVHTYREHSPDVTIRIISARRATTHERKQYEKANS